MTFVLPFPVFDPVALSIGPIDIRWYALAYIAGILIGWWYTRRLIANDALWPVRTPGRDEDENPLPRSGVKKTDLDDMIIWITLGIILGGRFGFVLVYAPGYYIQNPLEAFMLWQGGMSFHGGFAGVILAVSIFSYVRGVNPIRIGDVIAAAAPIGIFFGRIANFINGELWGRVTDVPWAMVFPMAGPDPRHPSQLYEAALEGVLLFLAIRIATHRFNAFHKPGMVIGIFVLGYGAGRTFVEFFRQYDPAIGLYWGWMSTGMALSIPMIIIGAGIIWFAQMRASKNSTLKTAESKGE